MIVKIGNTGDKINYDSFQAVSKKALKTKKEVLISRCEMEFSSRCHDYLDDCEYVALTINPQMKVMNVRKVDIGIPWGKQTNGILYNIELLDQIYDVMEWDRDEEYIVPAKSRNIHGQKLYFDLSLGTAVKKTR